MSPNSSRWTSSTVNCRRRLPKFPSTYRMQAAINTRARSRNAHTITTGHVRKCTTRERGHVYATSPPQGANVDEEATWRVANTTFAWPRERPWRGTEFRLERSTFHIIIRIPNSRVFLLPLAFYNSREVSIKEYDFKNPRNQQFNPFDLFVSRYDRIDPPSFLRWKLKFKRKERLFPCISRSESIRPVFRFLRGSLFGSRAGWLRSIEINSYEK